MFCSTITLAILYIISLRHLLLSRFGTHCQCNNKTLPQPIWTQQFKHILLAPLRAWLVIITSYSLWERPDALFCQGQDQSRTGRRRRGLDFVPIRHLEPPQWRGTCNQGRHKMESQLATHTSVSQKARGGGENASGSIRPTSYLHLQLRAPSPGVISATFTAATLEY